MIDWKAIPSKVHTYVTVVLALALGMVFTIVTAVGVYVVGRLLLYLISVVNKALAG